MSRRASSGKRALRALLALVVGLGVCELGLQLLARQVQAADGSRGLSVDLSSWAGSPGETEILCVGDSNTYGVYLDAEDAYPAQLQRLVGEHARVLNLGVPGLNSAQALVRTRNALEQVRPEALVVQVGLNNMWSWVPQDEAEGARPWYEELRLVRLARLAFARVEDAPSVEDVQRGYEREDIEGGRPAYVLEGDDRLGGDFELPPPPSQQVDVDQALLALERDLLRFQETAKRIGAQFLVATYGSDSASYGVANQVLRSSAREHGFTLVECAPVLEAHREWLGEPWLYYRDHHPRRVGYELVARTVHDALVQRGVLTTPLVGDPHQALECVDRSPSRVRYVRAEGAQPAYLELYDEQPGALFALFASASGEGEPAEHLGLHLGVHDDPLFRAALARPSLRGVIDAEGVARCALEEFSSGGEVLLQVALFSPDDALDLWRLGEPIALALD